MELQIRKDLSPEQVAQIIDFTKLVAAADGFAAFDEQTLLNLTKEDTVCYVLPKSDCAELPGLALLNLQNGNAEMAVHPSWRRQGLGRKLVRALRRAQVELPSQISPLLWAHGTLPAAEALAAACGLETKRELLVLGKEFTDVSGINAEKARIPASKLLCGENWELRSVADADLDREDTLRILTELNSEIFASHPEQGKLQFADFQQRFSQRWFRPELCFFLYLTPTLEYIATEESRAMANPVGFFWLKPVDEVTVELYVLGILPKMQGSGLGGALVRRLPYLAAAAGYERAILYVDGENTAAVHTYKKGGFREIEKHTGYFL